MPLHIFENRYRRLMADLLALPETEQRFGIVSITKGSETNEDLPAIAEIGTIAVLRKTNTNPDGTFDIMVVGGERFDVKSISISKAPYLIAEVKERKESPINFDQAILNWTEKLDGVKPQSLRVPQEVIDKAFSQMPADVIEALEESIKRSKAVHQSQVRKDSQTQVVTGGIVSERWLPVDRVGLYVPGGNAVYPSSVVMNVVPAQVAGVRSIAVASPAQKENNGWPNKTILAACKILGITEIYAVGGAQAIAMFAYGSETCEPVNMVTGPGNIYVTAAKRVLRGVIGIDSEAGPTEIAILADESGNASWIAPAFFTLLATVCASRV